MEKAKYIEPTDYIPEEIRKELKLGEFAEEEEKREPKKQREIDEKIRNHIKDK